MTTSRSKVDNLRVKKEVWEKDQAVLHEEKKNLHREKFVVYELAEKYQDLAEDIGEAQFDNAVE